MGEATEAAERMTLMIASPLPAQDTQRAEEDRPLQVMRGGKLIATEAMLAPAMPIAARAGVDGEVGTQAATHQRHGGR